MHPIDDLINYFNNLVHQVFIALMHFFTDVFVFIVHLVLYPIANLIASIPVPGFVNSTSFSSIINLLPPFALHMAVKLDLASAFQIILLGVLFNLTRKLFTLGQW